MNSRTKKKIFFLLILFSAPAFVLRQVALTKRFELDPPAVRLEAGFDTHPALHRQASLQVDDWSDVPGSEGRWLVYSAHLSVTPHGELRVAFVTALDQTLKMKKAFCHFWNSNESLITFGGEMTQLPEEVHRFTTAVIWCSMNRVKLGTFLRATVSSDEHTALDLSDALPVNGFEGEFSEMKTLFEDHLRNPVAQLKRRKAIENSLMFIQSPDAETDPRKKKHRKQNKIHDLAVCVRPIYGGYNHAFRIIEFVEIFKILGASFFYFYNHSIGADVDKVLQFYVEEREAEVLPWSLPDDVTKTIHAYGQLPSQNDCLLRASRFTFVAMLDLDEIFVPRINENLITILEDMGEYSSYVFRNLFFYTFWEDDTTFVSPHFTSKSLKNCSLKTEEFSPSSATKGLAQDASIRTKEDTLLAGSDDKFSTRKGPPPPGDGVCSQQPDAAFMTQRKTRRVAAPSAAHVRPKYIVRPRHAAVVNVHKVHQFQKGISREKLTYTVPERIALSHHYRDCELRTLRQCRNLKTKVDRTTHRFASELTSSVLKTLHAICDLQPDCGDLTGL